VSTERSRLLSSPLVGQAREAGFSEADIMGLAQAYTRGIGRIVAAESHVLARELVGIPRTQREQRARLWLAKLLPLTRPAFEELHVAQLEAAVESLLAGAQDRSPAELAVAFVDLCGSTEYMLASSRDEIRALAEGSSSPPAMWPPATMCVSPSTWATACSSLAQAELRRSRPRLSL
jgi:hypothetical protein